MSISTTCRRHSRIVLAALALWLAAPLPAKAQFLACLDQNQSWTNSYYQNNPAISAITYIVSMPVHGTPTQPADGKYLGWLIALYQAGKNVEMLVGISGTVANKFQSVTNADQLFAQTKNQYHELLLIEKSFCPLLAEDAAYSPTGVALWTH